MLDFLLLIIAIALFTIFAPFGILFVIIHSLLGKKNPLKYISSVILRIAVSIDQLGNTVCGDLLNAIMVKEVVYPFGNEDDTVSACLYFNRNNLSKLGQSVYNLLEWINPGHCYNASLK